MSSVTGSWPLVIHIKVREPDEQMSASSVLSGLADCCHEESGQMHDSPEAGFLDPSLFHQRYAGHDSILR
jgi:hypothetical protein